LVLNKVGDFVLLDAKLSLDDNALFRHPELESLKDITEENPLELEAAQNNMNYVKLDGSIGCMVNGAGLAMATMDIIKQFGQEPANFLDLGGTANKDRAIKGFKIIQSDPNVKSVLINIFGGIIHCDMIANGIVSAIKELDFKLPIVVRFQGTNASQGRDIINKSFSNLTSIDDLTKAAQKGHLYSQNKIARMYYDGEGVKKDRKVAFIRFKGLANMGYAESESKMGEMYYFGGSVIKDYKKSFKWFLRAAEQDDSYAQSMIGNMYFKGEGVKQNDTEAFRWSYLAAKKNEAYSQAIVAKLYNEGRGVKKDRVRAYAWYSLASMNEVESASEALDALTNNMSTEEVKEAEMLDVLKEEI